MVVMHRAVVLAATVILASSGVSVARGTMVQTLDLEQVEAPMEKAAYETWLAEQSPAMRSALAKTCAKTYEAYPACHGIGPFHLEEPPRRTEQDARAQWEAALSPEARAWVEKMCAGPKNLSSTLCGYDLPPAPKPGETYAAWRKTLSRNERGIVDDHCTDMATGTDEYCDGIGPLHLPVPPLLGAAMTRGGPNQAKALAAEQAAWDAWYRKLTAAQKAYYKYWCGPERGEISDLCGGTPLVVVLDGAPVAYAPAREDSRFAIDGISSLRTDWPTARTPWIARDLDGDGVIADGRELFGSGTLLPDGSRARDGFVALAALDDNADGAIDAHDRAWGELLVWRDRDGDRRGAGRELAPLSSVVERVSLRAERGARCDGRGNCERLRASALLPDGATGAIVDVQLLVQPPAH